MTAVIKSRNVILAEPRIIDAPRYEGCYVGYQGNCIAGRCPDEDCKLRNQREAMNKIRGCRRD